VSPIADRSIMVRIGANVTGLVSSLKTADRAAQDWGNKQLAWVQKNEQSINALSRNVGVLGAGLTGLAVLAVKKFADFDAAMSGVAATGDDARGSIDELRDAAIRAGADTVFSATEAADAITALAKAGVSAKDVLDGGLTGALDLAAASGMGVAEAAEVMATSLNQFEMSGEDATHVADLLAAAAGKAMGDVEDMAGAFKYVGPVAHQMGISIEETAGTIAYLAQQGVLGDQAGTSLRGMLTALTSPSKIAATEMKNLGINVYDASGKFVGFDGIAGQLQSTMGDLTNAERDQALGRIFGNEQITTARLLYQGGAKAIDTWTAAVNDQGYAAEVAATKMDNLKGDLEGLSGSFETALIGMGEGANGPLRELVQGLDGIVDRFNGMSDGAKQATLLTVGGGGLALLGVAAFGKMTVAVSETVTALRTMGIVSQASAGRVGAIVTSVGKFGGYAAGITAVAAGVGMMVDSLTRGEVVPKANALADALYRLGRTGDIENLNDQFDNFGTFIGMSTVDVKGLGDALAQSFNPSVTDRVAGFFDGIPGVTGYMEKLEDRFVGLDQSLASMVGSGHIDQARAAFEVIRGEAEAQGISIDDLRKKFPEYVDALVGAKNAVDDTADAQGGFEVAAAAANTVIEDQTEALATLIEAQAKLAGLVLSQRDAQRNLEASVDAVTDSIKENGTTLDITTEKGRSNQEALDGIASAGWDLIESMQANGAEQGELQATMQTTRDRFIAAAQQFGITGDEANALADELNLIPANVDTTATFTDNASTQIQEFVNRWAGKTVTVQAIMDATGFDRSMAASSARYTAQALAAAGRKAGGGAIYGPGTATSDTAGLFALSNGEHVLTASDVTKFGGQSAVYQMRSDLQSGKPRGLAGGGEVSRQYVAPTYITQMSAGTVQAEPFDYRRMGRETARALAGVQIGIDGRAVSQSVDERMGDRLR
jgi:TP901 family phage tail tape measure protein